MDPIFSSMYVNLWNGAGATFEHFPDLGPMLWFLKYFRQKISEKNGVFDTKQSQILKKNDHNIGFWKKRRFFRRKLSKIEENCDHNIDPWCRFYESPFWTKAEKIPILSPIYLTIEIVQLMYNSFFKNYKIAVFNDIKSLIFSNFLHD
jgi:hypothetical protein